MKTVNNKEHMLNPNFAKNLKGFQSDVTNVRKKYSSLAVVSKMSLLNNFLKFLFVVTYTGVSFFIFNLVYGASQEVIDEFFHIDQGLHYCHGFFSAVSFFRLFTFTAGNDLLYNLLYFSGIRK